MVETNGTFVNLSPYGEPQLGQRGLYRAGGAVASPDEELALLWVLSLYDGTASLLDVASARARRTAVIAARGSSGSSTAALLAISRRGQSGHARSRSPIVRSGASGHSMPNAGSSQRTPDDASGTYGDEIR